MPLSFNNRSIVMHMKAPKTTGESFNGTLSACNSPLELNTLLCFVLASAGPALSTRLPGEVEIS